MNYELKGGRRYIYELKRFRKSEYYVIKEGTR